MKALLWPVLAFCPLGYAEWLGQTPDSPHNGHGYGLPRATATSRPDSVNGWSPKPTEAPLVDSGSDVDFVELMRRSEYWLKAKRQTTNWLNSRTCGWFDSDASAPYTCGRSSTCSTNAANVVGCVSSGETVGPFFTVCLDYEASKSGLCKSVGSRTGCCRSSTLPACLMFVWPGPQSQSMYLCHTKPGVQTMLDVPLSVLEASTRSTSTSTTSSSATSESSTVTSPTSTNTDAPPAVNAPVNAGAIAGGIVGGVAGIALIAGGIAFFLIRRRNKASNIQYTRSTNPAYTAVPPNDSPFPTPGMPPYSPPKQNQAGFLSLPGNSTLRSDTPYLANSITPPNQTDPRYSYQYDPSKPPEMQQGYPQYGAGGLYPHATPDSYNSQYGQGQGYTPPPPPQGVGLAVPGQYQPYAPQPQQQFRSELDSGSVVTGQRGNPAEMPGESESRR
ncbi:hypothetical protein QBC40DRAFT_32664 [Triangularia verruculosa]|uniref:Transmembrane protein n=1 Tax=Triangularia verruculosa TaxID=2587418 RepID=A0AAN7APN7_9PEZI|nr:hypothetical protein QBC40DRAFT_32664 [Triangularia verruculosa]